MPSSLHHDSESVRQFFDQWEIYKKVVAENYMYHREAYAAIASALRESPFSFLDLGAGDAQWTSRILEGRPVTHYHAVDLSQPALELAEVNTRRVSGEKAFTQADFSVELPPGKFDLVFIGMSLHHLPIAEKKEFLPRLRSLLNEHGRLLFYELIRRKEESREQVLARWWDHVLQHWSAMAPAELSQIREHVFSSDYQESIGDYLLLAKECGFAGSRLLYTDPNDFYAVIECPR